MPVYEYLAYDADGTLLRGSVDADSEKAARFKLKSEGMLVSKLILTTDRKSGVSIFDQLRTRVGEKDITGFTRQLATLQNGNLPITESLDILLEQTENIGLSQVVSSLREKVMQGSSLGNALEDHPRYFDSLYVNLVKGGEESGALGEVLTRLADYKEYRVAQKSKVVTSMIYPLFIMMTGVTVITFLLTYVIPKLQVMFDDIKGTLPTPTVILLAISQAITQWWPLLVAIIAGSIFFFIKYRSSKKGRKNLDRIFLKLPLFGKLIHDSAIAEFSRSMSTLLSGGVPLLEALRITANIINNVLIKEAIENAIVTITEGENLADPLKNSGLFPSLVTQMILAGERTGQLPHMLRKVADAYDFEVDTKVKNLIAVLEPIMIVLTAFVVGFMVMAVLLPIFELSQSIG